MPRKHNNVDNDLAANRNGYLSSRQSCILGLEGIGGLVVAVALVILPWFLPSSLGYQLFRLLMAVIGTMVVFGESRLIIDVLSNKTAVVSGEFTKSHSRTPRGYYHYLLVQNSLELSVTETQYKNIDEKSHYQVFYLPLTKRVMSVYDLGHGAP